VGAALPVILQETAGAQTTYYVYGLDLIASIQGSTPTYYLTDGLGSTTRLADGAGAVTGAYTYDAFGAVRSHTGASTQWSFTGEQNDANGLEYLRARYYDPALGRFLSRDPFAGLVAVPQSLNRYAYVLNNPIRWVDPWGLRNVEGTPTPTPSAKYLVCRAIYEHNVDCHYLVPSSGMGLLGDIGHFAKAYWEHSPDYLFYQHVVAPAWEFATTRSPTCYVIGGIELGGIAMTFAPQTAPLGRAISLVLAEPAATSCFGE
jgi:RHS repeat-associated protein